MSRTAFFEERAKAAAGPGVAAHCAGAVSAGVGRADDSASPGLTRCGNAQLDYLLLRERGKTEVGQRFGFIVEPEPDFNRQRRRLKRAGPMRERSSDSRTRAPSTCLVPMATGISVLGASPLKAASARWSRRPAA